MVDLKERVNLEEFIKDFQTWQKTMKSISEENTAIKLLNNMVKKQIQESQITEKETNQKCLQLREMIEKLQKILDARCNFEDENAQLKKQIADNKEIAEQLEQSHKSQMDEALKKLEASQQAHIIEIRRLQENNQHQNKREVSLLEKTIQEKNGEIRELTNKLTNMERNKHTEIVKLRLEYDAKLLKAQKTHSKHQSGLASKANNEIFRKKLQFAKNQADQEVISLKSKINEMQLKINKLQQQLQTSQHSTQKRRKLSNMTVL